MVVMEPSYAGTRKTDAWLPLGTATTLQSCLHSSGEASVALPRAAAQSVQLMPLPHHSWKVQCSLPALTGHNGRLNLSVSPKKLVCFACQAGGDMYVAWRCLAFSHWL